MNTILLTINAALLAFLSVFAYRAGSRLLAEVRELRAAASVAATRAAVIAANLERSEERVRGVADDLAEERERGA